MKIDHITYYGGRLTETQKFYGEILKLETKTVNNKLWVKVGEDYIIHLSDNPNFSTSGSHFTIQIENLFDFSQSLVNKKIPLYDITNYKLVNLEKIEPNIDHFFVQDPADNLIEFIK